MSFAANIVESFEKSAAPMAAGMRMLAPTLAPKSVELPHTPGMRNNGPVGALLKKPMVPPSPSTGLHPKLAFALGTLLASRNG
jgi:hypothetical protein